MKNSHKAAAVFGNRGYQRPVRFLPINQMLTVSRNELHERNYWSIINLLYKFIHSIKFQSKWQRHIIQIQYIPYLMNKSTSKSYFETSTLTGMQVYEVKKRNLMMNFLQQSIWWIWQHEHLLLTSHYSRWRKQMLLKIGYHAIKVEKQK